MNASMLGQAADRQVPRDVRSPHRVHFPGGAGGSQLDVELLGESEEVLSKASEDDDDDDNDDPELLGAESAFDLEGTVIVDSLS